MLNKKINIYNNGRRGLLGSRELYRKTVTKDGRFTIIMRGRTTQQEIDTIAKKLENGSHNLS